MNLAEQLKIITNYLTIRNFTRAIEISKKILKKTPNNSFTLNLLGLAYQGKGSHTLAINAFEKAIFYDEKNVSPMNNLANTYKKVGEYEKAERLYNNILKINPNYIQAIHNYANLKKSFLIYDKAIELFKDALKKDPNNNVIRYSLATSLQNLGNFEEAKTEILKILEKDPKFMIAHKVLSEIKEYKLGDPHFNEMLDLINNENIEEIKKIELHFAIGKAYEDIKDYSLAFKHFKLGNKIKKQFIKYEIKSEIVQFKNIMESFKKINFEKQSLKKSNHKNIIFICGMPRSGTTLVEQIISTHKEVYGAGELIYLSQSIGRNILDENFSLSLNKILKQLEKPSNDIEQYYNNQLNYHETSAKFITDKAPQNFKWIGFMRLFFPNCKIVHCARNPKDNCLSLYKNNFPSNSMNWSYDEEDIVNYYNGYEGLINFWKSKIPNFIYDLNYENLVKNQEVESKKLLNFCGLSWDPDCMEFYKKNKTPIKTVSIKQARSPIYNKSINSNELYSKYLPTLFNFFD
jgi:Tfp pilus assembly protein PilF